MQVPYEYRRSQTLASKFAHSVLTQRQYDRRDDSSVEYFADAQYDGRKGVMNSSFALDITKNHRKSGRAYTLRF